MAYKRRSEKGLIVAATLGALLGLAQVQALAQDGPDIPQATRAETELLKSGGRPAPGAQILNYEIMMTCTLSWAARDPVTGDVGYLTAGHCGNSGQAAEIVYPDGTSARIGEFAWSSFDFNNATSSSVDAAFLVLDDPSLLDPNVIGLGQAPTRALDDADLERLAPDLCKVGHMTGTTCGNIDLEHDTLQRVMFFAPSSPGDSGGPVYARTKAGELVAAGIFVGVPNGMEQLASAQVLDGVAEIWDVELIFG